DEAFLHLQSNPEPQLLIMEWRLPGLSAPMLLQRVRGHGYLSVPIVVLSSLLKPADRPLVREMGVAVVVAKPLTKDRVIPSMIGWRAQERAPTDAASMERKIRQFLAAGKKDDAAELKAKSLADPQVSLGKKRLIEAEWAFANGQYAQARDLGAEALKLVGDGF